MLLEFLAFRAPPGSMGAAAPNLSLLLAAYNEREVPAPPLAAKADMEAMAILHRALRREARGETEAARQLAEVVLEQQPRNALARALVERRIQ